MYEHSFSQYPDILDRLLFRLKEHVQMHSDPRIRQLLIENLMKSGGSEEMLQQVVRNYPYVFKSFLSFELSDFNLEQLISNGLNVR